MSQIVEFETQGSALCVRPTVEYIFETETVSSIQKSILEKVAEVDCYNLAIDFTSVQTFASNFIGMLVGLKRQLVQKGGDLRLSGINERLMEIVQITKLDQVFGIFATLPEAIQSY